MTRLDALNIEQPFIALFGSGNSVNALSSESFDYIKARAFVITINYAPIRVCGHLNMWSDRKVSEFLNRHYQDHHKDCLLLCQEHRAVGELTKNIDYWFNRRVENLKGNYTLVWALQLLKKYYPDKTILLFGVDMYAPDNEQGKWYDSFTDFDRKKRGSRYNVQTKLNQCAQQIANYVPADNVINCNPKSHLKHFKKAAWQTVFPLTIAHFTNTPLAGAPVHLSSIINKYTSSTSTAVLRKGFSNRGKLSNLAWEYDVEQPDNKQQAKLADAADVIHFHGRPWESRFGNTPTLLQYHSPPRGYRPETTHKAFNNQKLVIAQYHPRFYTDARIVPNMIDIWDERWMPAEKPTDKVVIFYSWASEVRGGWSDKGSSRTKSILSKIEQRYGRVVEVIVMNNRPYEECMAAKRRAHICIDECVTGSYHLQSLEGCAVGALTFNNLDETTASFINIVTGANDHPFETTELYGLYARLCHFIDNRDELMERGKKARKWMEQHWDPRVLVGHFMSAYFNLMLHGSVHDAVPSVHVPEIPVVQAKDVVPVATPARSNQPLRRTSVAGQRTRKRSTSRPLDVSSSNDREAGRQIIALERSGRVADTKRKRKKVRKTTPIKAAANQVPERYTQDQARKASIAAARAVPAPVYQPVAGRAIHALHNQYAGETIYIFGTGPSLFSVDPDHYRDKICLGINFAYEHMPHINYHFASVVDVYEAMKAHVEPSQLILPETLVHQQSSEAAANAVSMRAATSCPEAYVYPIQNPAESQLGRKHVNLEQDALMFTWSATTHSAIHVAAYMGAKRIVLIGVDYQRFPNGKVHFNAKAQPAYGNQRWENFDQHRRADSWLRQQLGMQHNIELVNEGLSYLKTHNDMVA